MMDIACIVFESVLVRKIKFEVLEIGIDKSLFKYIEFF